MTILVAKVTKNVTAPPLPGAGNPPETKYIKAKSLFIKWIMQFRIEIHNRQASWYCRCTLQVVHSGSRLLRETKSNTTLEEI
jgi:hypothetical protein